MMLCWHKPAPHQTVDVTCTEVLLFICNWCIYCYMLVLERATVNYYFSKKINQISCCELVLLQLRMLKMISC